MTDTSPTYAVVRLGGRQYKVTEGQDLLVDRLAIEPGDSVTLQPLFVRPAAATSVTDTAGAKVTAAVVEHLLGEKVRVCTYKPKSTFKRARGHRSRLSRITIESIALKEKNSGS